jgi:hypothetical protein
LEWQPIRQRRPFCPVRIPRPGAYQFPAADTDSPTRAGLFSEPLEAALTKIKDRKTSLADFAGAEATRMLSQLLQSDRGKKFIEPDSASKNGSMPVPDRIRSRLGTFRFLGIRPSMGAAGRARRTGWTGDGEK